MEKPERQVFSTAQASGYLSSRGCPTSPSLLEKMRYRGSEDQRDHGPDYFRTAQGYCQYPRDALDRYVEMRLASQKFRGPAPQPPQFRRTG